jgi:hypothetical protein
MGSEVRGQPLSSTYESPAFVTFESHLYSTDSIFHTSIRPYSIPDLKKAFDYDSVRDSYAIERYKDSRLWNSVFNRNLVTFEEEDFAFTIDPLFDFQYGYETEEGKSTWTNTRGLLVEGSVGEDFAFSTRFYENQAVFPGPVHEYIRRRRAIPGQGWTRGLNNAYDYTNASGYISYTPGNYFNFQLGHGKHFFGDGYRSLLLSDHALYYPYFKITSTIWRFKYVNMWTQFNHPEEGVDPGINAYPRKYGSFHYLSFLAGKRWNISLFEAIIWQAQDSAGFRGFDPNYLNPMIWYRPIEYTLSSADNAFMGANLSFIAHDQVSFYTQFIIDEFRWREIKAGNGWHGNKFAWQIGMKSFNPFNIKNLYLQAEYNLVRPYMYSHYLTTQSYTHQREPLAYSYGANTKEFIAIGRYHYKRLFLDVKYNRAVFGLDTAGLNFGKNIFLNYQDRVSDYNNTIAQGLTTTMDQVDATLSFLINPSTNMNLFLAATWRRESNEQWENKYVWIHFGWRTSLRNLYYDFY